MQTLPHLCKRGNVYQWRRRSRRQSTGIVDLKLSLGTTDLTTALILSRKISAESDIVIEDLADRKITPQDARAWLSLVVRRERDKIEKLKMMRRFDANDPDDDLRHDEAARTVWQHIASKGLNAPLPRDSADDGLLSRYIDMFRADLTSDARARIVSRDFRELTGHQDVSALHIITLMNLLIEGKAAAWGRHDSILSPLSTMADQMLDADHGLMGPEISDVSALSVENSIPLSTATTQKQDAAPTDRPNENAENITEDPSKAEMNALDPSISAVVRRMNEIKRDEKIEEKNLRQYESFATLFTLLTGISDIRQIRQPDVKKFRANLQELPKSWGKSPSDRIATREQIMARGAKLPPEKRGLSVGTVNRHLEHLAQIVEAALDEGFQIDSRLKPAKLRLKDTVRESEKKEAFSKDNLIKLFKSPVWTGSESERFQTRRGPTVYKNGIYWCPLIGAYTGARREEIAGLAPSDIVTLEGVPCFYIEDSEIRRIKNISSKRHVPIHSRLIELGFLDHVKRMKAQGTELFPSLREPATGQHGKKLGRRMRQIVDEALGPTASGLSFHSLRHYVQGILEHHPGLSDKVTRDLLGHEGKDVHDKNYSKPSPTERLRQAVEALPVVF